MNFAKRLASVAGAIACLGAALVGIALAAAPIVVTIAAIALVSSGGGNSISFGSPGGSKNGFYATMGSFISGSLNKSANLAKFALTGNNPFSATAQYDSPRLGRR